MPDAGADGAPGATISLHRLAGITALSATHVEVYAGTSFAQLYSELARHGLTLAWSPGGIQGLTVGGAVSVGFHGSQQSLGGVSSVVSALRLVDTQGRVHDLTETTDPEGLAAARLCAGQCGVLTRVTLPVAPQFHLRRRRWRLDDGERFLAQLPALKAAHDRFHWYHHPATASWWPMLWEPASADEAAADAPCLTAAEQAGDAALKEFGVDGLPLIMRCLSYFFLSFFARCCGPAAAACRCLPAPAAGACIAGAHAPRPARPPPQVGQLHRRVSPRAHTRCRHGGAAAVERGNVRGG